MTNATTFVIGAGVVGIATAWALHRRGVAVTVVEAQPGPGLGASAANGFLLHPSLVEPWNSPGILPVLWRSLGREDSAVLLRARALPSLLGWGVRFVRDSSPSRFESNALRNVRLAVYSLRCMREIDADTGIDYAQLQRGTLTIFRDEEGCRRAREWYAKLEAAGLAFQWLTREGVVAMEPALAAISAELVGGVHAPGDESGDSLAFCEQLARVLAQRGVHVEFGRRVAGLSMVDARGVAVRFADGEVRRAERVVVASGVGSPALLKTIGLSLPVRPAKGYSMTLPRDDDGDAPWMPTIDASLHIAVNPVDRTRIRVAGSAEFVGFDRTVNAARVANLRRVLQRTFPAYAARIAGADARPWTELRPMSADGVPIVGATRHPGVYVNTGHGHIGWTVAAGSAALLADLVVGRSAEICAGDYSPARFD
jgi:D-amino-acid dehydrogenase